MIEILEKPRDMAEGPGLGHRSLCPKARGPGGDGLERAQPARPPGAKRPREREEWRSRCGPRPGVGQQGRPVSAGLRARGARQLWAAGRAGPLGGGSLPAPGRLSAMEDRLWGQGRKGVQTWEVPETETKARQSTPARHAHLPWRRHRAAWPWPGSPSPTGSRGDFLGPEPAESRGPGEPVLRARPEGLQGLPRPAPGSGDATAVSSGDKHSSTSFPHPSGETGQRG